MRRADHPAVGLVLDTFHILARGTDLSAIRAIPRDRIFLVQVADAPLLDMDYLSWSRHFRNFPGQGDLPLARLHGCAAGDRLRRAAVAGNLQRPVPRRLGAQVAVDGHRSLIFLLDRLRARGPAARCRLPPMPPRAQCLGVEFIEFAVDEAAPQRFEGLCWGLASAAPAGTSPRR